MPPPAFIASMRCLGSALGGGTKANGTVRRCVCGWVGCGCVSSTHLSGRAAARGRSIDRKRARKVRTWMTASMPRRGCEPPWSRSQGSDPPSGSGAPSASTGPNATAPSRTPATTATTAYRVNLLATKTAMTKTPPSAPVVERGGGRAHARRGMPRRRRSAARHRGARAGPRVRRRQRHAQRPHAIASSATDARRSSLGRMRGARSAGCCPSRRASRLTPFGAMA